MDQTAGSELSLQAPSLPGHILDRIARSERPDSHTAGGVRCLSNRDEQEITTRSDASGTRFFKRFRTPCEGRPHVYDTVSGEIHPISDLEWMLLDELRWDIASLTERFPQRHPADLEGAVRRLRDILAPMTADHFTLGAVPDHLPGVDSNLIRTLVINVTEQCNLRCTYCYYGGAYEQTRGHRSAQPRLESVRQAIDRFLSHHAECQGAQRALYLFGGEPLLDLSFIQRLIASFEARAAELGLDVSNVLIQIATNGLLLTERVAGFLAEKGIFLNVSIDGPNHDRYRVTAAGRGSLGVVRGRIEWLAGQYPEYFASHVGLVCVVSPPVDLSALYGFFAEWWPARQALHLDFDLVLAAGTDVDDPGDTMEAAKEQLWRTLVRLHGQETAARRRSMAHGFVTGFNFLHRAFHRALHRDRSVVTDGRLTSLLGVQGSPGVFLAVLGSDGGLYGSYEYQSPPWRIGSAEEGLEAGRVRSLMRSFRDAAQVSSCRSCWAVRLCNVDYPDATFFDSDSAADVTRKVAAKQQRCAAERRDLAAALGALQEIVHRHGEQALELERQEQSEIVAAGLEPSPFNEQRRTLKGAR